jgi:hypothetical protein
MGAQDSTIIQRAITQEKGNVWVIRRPEAEAAGFLKLSAVLFGFVMSLVGYLIRSTAKDMTMPFSDVDSHSLARAMLQQLRQTHNPPTPPAGCSTPRSQGIQDLACVLISIYCTSLAQALHVSRCGQHVQYMGIYRRSS